jgi:hypothetical protein
MYFSEWRKIQKEVEEKCVVGEMDKKQFFPFSKDMKKKRKKMLDIDSEHYPIELT